MMTVFQNRFYQHQSGYLDYVPDFALAVSWPMFVIWRESGGATLRSAEFLKVLDELREQIPEQ